VTFNDDQITRRLQERAALDQGSWSSVDHSPSGSRPGRTGWRVHAVVGGVMFVLLLTGSTVYYFWDSLFIGAETATNERFSEEDVYYNEPPSDADLTQSAVVEPPLHPTVTDPPSTPPIQPVVIDAAWLAQHSPDEIFAVAQQFAVDGQLDSALVLWETAAQRRHGPSARAIAEMYDPRLSGQRSSPFSQPNVTFAQKWYARAADYGDAVAQAQLAELDAWARGSSSVGMPNGR
jgi:hypothetical protein